MHASWIDCVPYAIRYNCILHQHLFTLDKLFQELFGELCTASLPKSDDGEDDWERGGIVAWGEPWDADGWEITPKQWRKFGFLYTDCEEVIASNNRRRMERGEEPLDVDQFGDCGHGMRREGNLVKNGPLEAIICEGEGFSTSEFGWCRPVSKLAQTLLDCLGLCR
jgi:hypothetical protein